MTDTNPSQPVAPQATTPNTEPVKPNEVKPEPKDAVQERFDQIWARAKTAEDRAAEVEAQRQREVAEKDAKIAELEAEKNHLAISSKQADINAAYPEATKYLKEFPELGFSKVKSAEEYETAMKSLNERLLSKQTAAPPEAQPTPANPEDKDAFITPTPPADPGTGEKKPDFKTMPLEDYRNIPEEDRLEFGRSLEAKA